MVDLQQLKSLCVKNSIPALYLFLGGFYFISCITDIVTQKIDNSTILKLCLSVWLSVLVLNHFTISRLKEKNENLFESCLALEEKAQVANTYSKRLMGVLESLDKKALEKQGIILTIERKRITH